MYWITLSRGVLGGDAGELQFVPPILGLTHPTGYPLQVLLHAAWSSVPFGSVAYRLNLLDAAIAASAVGLVFACGLALSGRIVPSVGGTAAFALNELWWSQAVRGDKYTLNGLFVALVLLLFMRWRRRSESVARLRVLALAFGLSLTHHRSMLLLVPALLVGLLLHAERPMLRREAPKLLLLVTAPLLLYVYVPWAGARGLPPGSWPVNSPGALLEYFTDPGYTSQLRPDAAISGGLIEEGTVLLRSFGPLGVALGLIGLGWTSARDRRLAAVLMLAFVAQAVAAASYSLDSNYQLPRHWVFYLPSFLVWTLWITAGLDAIRHIAKHSFPRPEGFATVVLCLVAVTLQTGTVWIRGAELMLRAQLGAETLDGYRQDLQRSPLAERFGRLAFESADLNALLVCDWEQATVLWYLQRVEGQRPDLVIRYPIETLVQSIEEARRTGRALYVARSVAALRQHGLPSSDGPLLRLTGGDGEDAPPSALPVGASLDGGITLAGVTYHASRFRPGDVLPLTIFWHADRQPDEDYSVSVRLLAEDGSLLAQHDERHPALGTSPTSTWPAGSTVGDYHELPIGNRLSPGFYRVGVVMYRPEPLRDLRRIGDWPVSGQEVTELPPISVEPRGRLWWDGGLAH